MANNYDPFEPNGSQNPQYPQYPQYQQNPQNPQYQQAIEQARKETWACMGQSVPLLVDYMIDKREQLLRKPETDGETKT